MEEWRAIPGYEGLYEVSDQGGVRSLDRLRIGVDGRIWRFKGRILRLRKRRKGYLEVSIYKDGIESKPKVHSLVLLAFVGPKPQGMEACHDNGIPGDNRRENLRYGTSQENTADAIKHGRFKVKLSKEKVREIRKKIKEGAKQKDIAVLFNVSASTIADIQYKRTWTHVL